MSIYNNKKIILRRLAWIRPGTFFLILKTYLSGRLNNGNSISSFESNYSQSLGNIPCVSTSYGIHSLYLILNFFKFHDKSILLIPAYTSYTIKDLLKFMKIPYQVVPIDKKTGCMCPKMLAPIISNETTGILVTHLLGNVCDSEIFEIAKSNNLIIIEDCAHAHGANLNGKPVGTIGDAGFFSFDPAKIINTFSGGILVSQNKKLINYAKAESNKLLFPSTTQTLIDFIIGYKEYVFSVFLHRSFSKTILGNKKILKKVKEICSPRKSNFFKFYKFQNIKGILGNFQIGILQKTLKIRSENALFLEKKLSMHFSFLDKRKGDVYYYFILFVEDSVYYQKKLIDFGIDSGAGEEIMQVMDNSQIDIGTSFAVNKYLQVPIHGGLSKDNLIYIAESLILIKQAYQLKSNHLD